MKEVKDKAGQILKEDPRASIICLAQLLSVSWATTYHGLHNLCKCSTYRVIHLKCPKRQALRRVKDAFNPPIKFTM